VLVTYLGDLQTILYQNDDRQKFEGFKKLPPEIRVRIYNFYFDSCRKPLHAPRQPPIVFASQLTWREASSIFYSTFTFEIHLIIPADGARPLLSGGHRLTMRSDTRGWIDGTRQENLADIQSLRIRVFHEYTRSSIIEALLQVDLAWSTSQGGKALTRTVMQNHWPKFNMETHDAK
jgi:hypothetical protein